MVFRKKPRRRSVAGVVRNRSFAQLHVETLEKRRLLSATRLDSPEALVGDVQEFQLTEDERFGVYLADAETDGLVELYSVELDSGEVTKLNGFLPDSFVRDFAVSPDSSRVVFRTVVAPSRLSELYSVPIDGGEAIRLHDDLVAGGGVGWIRPWDRSYTISPDSSRVVYVADKEVDNQFDLYSVAIDGGDTLQLNNPVIGEAYFGMRVSPDSSRVVFQARAWDKLTELYSVPLTGGELTPLSGPLAALAGSFQVSADSNTVVYLAGQEDPKRRELFQVPLTGGETVRLNGPLVAGGDVADTFQISPDSTWVVYTADQDVDRVLELYSVSLVSGEGQKLNQPFGDDGDVNPWFTISPDSSRVAFTAHQDDGYQEELFSVSIVGGDVTKLSGPLGPMGDVQSYPPFHGARVSPILITPDSSRVVYKAFGHSGDRVGIYSVPLGGGEFTRLAHAPEGTIDEIRITPDGGHVVYESDEFYSVPIAGGDSVRLSGPLVEHGHLGSFDMSPNGTLILYTAAQDIPGVSELFVAPLSGGESIKRSGPLLALGGSVSQFQLSDDGRFAVYLADQALEGFPDLYSLATDTGAIVKLNEGGNVERFELTPDGSRVVYLSDSSGVSKLISVPIAGGTNMQLVELRPGSHDEFEFQISADSSFVAYRTDQDTADAFELYSVPVSGGDSVKLNGPLVSEGDVLADFLLSPDGSHVVYLADQDTDAAIEIYSAPLSGGGSTRLNPPLGFLQAVKRGFQISSDSTRVVYLADQDTDNMFELYSVPLTGGAAVKLNGPMPPGGDVRDQFRDAAGFQISPDNQWVVYVADQETDTVFELFRVPLTGGDSFKLNEPLVWGGGILPGFQITADGDRVVYRADQTTDDVTELYSVTIDGDATEKLNPAVPPGGDVLDFQLNSQDTQAVFRISRGAFLEAEIYSSSLSGGNVAKLNASLAERGGVEPDYRISEDGQRVVYLADQDGNNSFGLYVTPIAGGPSQVLNPPLVSGSRVHEGFQLSEDGETIYYLANLEDAAETGLYTTIIEEPPQPLAVTSVTPTGTGLTAIFDREIDSNALNLYDSELAQLGSADMILEGAASGLVRGSLVVDPSLRSITFIKSGGLLVPDVYTYRLASGGAGFRSLDGGWLDGNGNGSHGGDLVGSFTVPELPVGTRTIRLPDFVRGPGQAVQLPASSTNGLPVSISDGSGVRSVELEIHFVPEMLTIESAQISRDMPAGTTIDFDASAAGVATITLTSPRGLPSGPRTLVHLQAVVPTGNAARIYGEQQLLRLARVEVLDSTGIAFETVVEEGLHLVEYFGDVTGNGIINASDAAHLARVSAQLDTGFAATPLTDPGVVGDISGNGVLNAADAALVAQFAGSMSVSEIPPIPLGIFPRSAGGRMGALADPTGILDPRRFERQDAVEIDRVETLLQPVELDTHLAAARPAAIKARVAAIDEIATQWEFAPLDLETFVSALV